MQYTVYSFCNEQRTWNDRILLDIEFKEEKDDNGEEDDEELKSMFPTIQCTYRVHKENFNITMCKYDISNGCA